MHMTEAPCDDNWEPCSCMQPDPALQKQHWAPSHISPSCRALQESHPEPQDMYDYKYVDLVRENLYKGCQHNSELTNRIGLLVH
jgi:hypothetical protein